MFEIETPRQLVVRQRRGLDQKLATALTANIVLYLPKQLAAHAARLRLLTDGNPVKVPAPVRHGCRSVVREADDLAALLEGDGAVPMLVHFVVIIVEHLLQGFDFN